MNLADELRCPEFRRAFFLAEASSMIARQLITCRKRRGLSQERLAAKLGSFQTAVSRMERADYRAWSFSRLFKVADALGCRLRVTIEPWEDVVDEYDAPWEASA